MNNVLSKRLLTDNVWIGDVQLKFSLRQGKSVLTKCKCSGPFVVQRGFYPQQDKCTPHVYLLHPAGGLVSGDKLILNVELDSNSRALLTTVDSSKFYRTNNGLYASQNNTFKLSKNSILEWVPQSSIFFPKSKVIIENTFILEHGARVIAFEMLCFSSVVLDFNYIPKEINFFLSINLPHSVGLQERLKFNELDYIAKLGGFKISAMFFSFPSNKEMLSRVRALIQKEFVDEKFQIGGATLLEELLVVRLLGNDNQSISRVLYHLWYLVRPMIVGRVVTIPRIWNV